MIVKLVKKSPNRRSQTSRHSGDVLAEPIQNKKRRKQRNWKLMSDDRLVSYAKKFIEENKIKTRNELFSADCGLGTVLQRRRLLNRIPGLERPSSMSDEELIAHTKKIIKENEITSRIILRRKFWSIYDNLTKRKLMDSVISEKRECRDWASKSDEELIDFAKKFIEKNKIKGREALREVDAGLYAVLSRRTLLISVLQLTFRDWASMTDDEILSSAKQFINERKIKNRIGLQNADLSLYTILKRRSLFGGIFPKINRRPYGFFSKMSDKKLIEFAKDFIIKNEIKSKSALGVADSGLYSVLRDRKLQNAVFSPIEYARKTEAVKQVVDAMVEFGEVE